MLTQANADLYPNADDPLVTRAVDLGMYVHGTWHEAGTGLRYDILNPANECAVGSVPLGGGAEAALALTSAQDALKGWRATSVEKRAFLLARAVDRVAHNSRELACLLTREQGKPLTEAMDEIAGFVAKMTTFIALGTKVRAGGMFSLPSMRSSSYGRFDRSEYGIVVGLMAWNFPVELMAKKIGPALISGNTVVIKPAFSTPLATLRAIALMNEAGLPPGVLNCVTGRGGEIGQQLIRSKLVACVHLTGSMESGRSVAEATVGNATDLKLELAGSDPMIVCADADLRKAVHAAMFGRFRNAGQACTAVKRLYVAAGIYDSFLRELINRVSLLQPGDGMMKATPPRTRIGPLHTEGQRRQLQLQIEDATDRGAQLLVGGKLPADAALERGYFLEPTILAGVCRQSRVVSEEVFGPVLPVFRTGSIAEAIELANDGAFDLGASIWTNDAKIAKQAARAVRCRQMWVNRLHFGRDQVQRL